MTAELQQKFREYDRANPGIYEAFERFALMVIQKRRRYGAKAIMERVRWHTMESGGDDFKINNNYTAYYVRKFEALNPKHKDFFKKRSIKGRDDSEMKNPVDSGKPTGLF